MSTIIITTQSQFNLLLLAAKLQLKQANKKFALNPSSLQWQITLHAMFTYQQLNAVNPCGLLEWQLHRTQQVIDLLAGTFVIDWADKLAQHNFGVSVKEALNG